jgi:aldehyde:ferredoxin oxidoreductase
MSKSAFIDLSSGKIEIKETDRRDLRLFLGGRGLGAKWLYDLVGPEIEPLSPENVLIFTAGPLAGSPWPTSSRLHVTFKSPLTGAYGYANSGGFFAAELKQAGFDALVVSGQAEGPVVLEVFDDDISIRARPDLWGKRVSETHHALLGADLSPKAGRVACIGPAGENQVRIASIMNDLARAAARGGPGAVMGSKRLKAIHVRASSRPPLPPQFRQEAKLTGRKLKDEPLLEGLRQYGTLVLMDPKNATGDQPAKNHQVAQVPFISQVNAAAFDRYLLRHKGCYACPITCGRQSVVTEGQYAVELEGPEYESTNALGPMCWISNPQAIMYANQLCNEFGLDTISTGVTIAFAMELHEKGLLNDATLSLTWGDEASLIGLIERIAYRQGVGDLLADGTRLAAQAVGHEAEYYAMQVKGMELPRQEPRFAKGFGLGHATSNRGADHLYAMPAIDLGGNWEVAKKIFPAEIVPELMDPANEKYKADMVVYGEHYCAVTDALGICKFSTVEVYSLLPEDLAAGLSAILDEKISDEELLKVGERIVNLERMYNVRQGLSRADDTLPRRFSQEPAPLYDYDLDPETGQALASPELIRYGQIHSLEAMLDRYYALRRWDSQGKPTKEVLERLNLLEITNEAEIS